MTKHNWYLIVETSETIVFKKVKVDKQDLIRIYHKLLPYFFTMDFYKCELIRINNYRNQ